MLRWDRKIFGSTGLVATIGLVGGLFGRGVAYAVLAGMLVVASLVGGFFAWRYWERHTAAGRLHRYFRLQTARLRQLPGFAQASDHVYLILGPSFAGKSQMLAGAGLTRVAEMSDADHLHAAPPTFWLGDKGLYIELPGTLVESQALAYFTTTLKYLRARRVYRNLKGVIICLEAGALHTLRPHVHSLRAPLEQIAKCYGVCPPSFLVLTQTDALAGFSPCFAHLSDEQKDGPWGMSLSEEGAGSAQVDTGFGRMLAILRRLCALALGGHAEVHKRRAGFGFCDSIADLAPGLLHTIDTLFGWQNNIYAPVLRGVYLCASGADGYGASSSYFCTGLVRHVLPQTSATTRPVVYSGWRGLWQRCHIPLTLSMLVCVWMLWQAAAFVANRQLVQAAHRAMAAAVAAPGPAPAASFQAEAAERWLGTLEALRPLERQLARLQDHQTCGVPWYLRGGLSQSAYLHKPLSQAYMARMQTGLLKPVCSGGLVALSEHAQRYQTTQTPPSGNVSAALAHHLKAYLLLTGPKMAGEPAAAHAELVWLQEHLRAQLVEQFKLELDATDAARFFDALSRYMAPALQTPALVWRRDGQLVHQARAMLERLPVTDLLVAMFAAEVQQRNTLADVSLATLLGGIKSPFQSARKVASIYTRDGYDLFGQVFVEAQTRGGDLWVLRAKPLGAEALRRHALQVEKRYYERYIDAWQQLIDSIKIAEPRDVNQALTTVVDLTRNEPPPLLRLFAAIAHHTRLSQDRFVNEAPIFGHSHLQRFIVRLQQAAQALREPPAEATFSVGRTKAHTAAAHPVQQAFAGLVGFGVAAPGAAASETFLHGYQNRLLAVKQALHSCVLDSRESDRVLSLIQQFSQETLDGIAESEQNPGAVQRLQILFVQPLQSVAKSLARGARHHRGDSYCASVVEPFEALRYSYPFDPAGLDAPLADVLSFYRPESGHLWRYYNKELSQDILAVGEHFGFDSRLGGAMRLAYAPELLDYLNQAQSVTRALFNDGQEGMTLEVRLKPASFIQQLDLEVSGTKVPYGTQEWTSIQWPGPKPSQGAQLIVTGHNGMKETLKYDGAWGLFRLLESGSVHTEADTNLVRIDWPLAAQRGTASLEIRVLRRQNLLLGHSRRATLWGALRDARLVPPSRIAQGVAACRTSTD